MLDLAADPIHATTDRASCCAPATESAALAGGSRRRRLWELPDESHCPLIGVCLPLAALRKLAAKTVDAPATLSDYELHAATVHACGTRGALTESVQRELDRRYALVLRRHAQARTTEALAALWHEAVEQVDIAGPLWAALTHPRCDAALAVRICRDAHMLQHQAGAMARADLHALRELGARNAALERELAAERERTQSLQRERAAETAALGAEIARLRAELVAKNAELAALHGAAARLRAGSADLDERRALAERVSLLAERLRGLRRANVELREQPRPAGANERAARRGESAPSSSVERPAPQRDSAPAWSSLQGAARGVSPPAPSVPCAPDGDAMPARAGAPLALERRAVLCVGGRDGDVARYRDCIERHGGRFLHHDGGIEDNPRLLESSLAAADLVVCQAGCISHNAYWRVKEHCKRTGKRCVFLERPSVAALARGLSATPSS